jgi:hypothetical protein
MKKDADFFMKEFKKQLKFIKRHAHSNIGYGEDVMPILNLYNSLSDYDEKKSFVDALEEGLMDSDPEMRRFMIDLCLGFFVFRNVIGR